MSAVIQHQATDLRIAVRAKQPREHTLMVAMCLQSTRSIHHGQQRFVEFYFANFLSNFNLLSGQELYQVKQEV
jgi:hypothetical protein